jgi:hypothetical protein
MYCRAAYTVCAITEALNAFGAHHRRTEWLALSSCDLSQDRCRGPNRPRGLPLARRSSGDRVSAYRWCREDLVADRRTRRLSRSARQGGAAGEGQYDEKHLEAAMPAHRFLGGARGLQSYLASHIVRPGSRPPPGSSLIQSRPGPVTHSIISSARARMDCGAVRPSALAMLRLMTSSNFVGCSIGRSAGLAPLRILST